jgi:hypothetical protein
MPMVAADSAISAYLVFTPDDGSGGTGEARLSEPSAATPGGEGTSAMSPPGTQISSDVAEGMELRPTGESPTPGTAQPMDVADASEPPRRVKRVRVIRRLVVNGQVVREVAAEQVVGADVDTMATAANLQESLGTTDEATLKALVENVDLNLSGDGE